LAVKTGQAGFQGANHHESVTIHPQALRKVQDCEAQWQIVRNLRKPKAQTATGVMRYGEN
jgi:hypothetical protein